MAKHTVKEWFKALEDLNNMSMHLDIEESGLEKYSQEMVSLNVSLIEQLYVGSADILDNYLKEPEPKGLF